MYKIKFVTVGSVLLAAACFLAGCSTTPPAPGFGISVGVTQTQMGPDICISGMSFSPNGSVKTGYINIPSPQPNHTGPSGMTSASGTFLLKDFSMDSFGLIQCTNEQIQQNVSVSATDTATGNITFTTVPGAYWCANAPVATNFNGGCH
jgi:hypothetical protein